MKWGTRCWGVELPQVVRLPLLGPAFGRVWVFGFWFLVSRSFLFGWALGASHPFGGGLPGDVSERIRRLTSSQVLLVQPQRVRPKLRLRSPFLLPQAGALPLLLPLPSVPPFVLSSVPLSMLLTSPVFDTAILLTVALLRPTLPPEGSVCAPKQAGLLFSSMFLTASMVMTASAVRIRFLRVLPRCHGLYVLRCFIATMLKLTCVVRTMQFFSFLRPVVQSFCPTLRNSAPTCVPALALRLLVVPLCAL